MGEGRPRRWAPFACVCGVPGEGAILPLSFKFKEPAFFLIEFACGALTVIGLIALFLYGFIRSVLLKPLAIAGLAARKFSCGGFLRPHQC